MMQLSRLSALATVILLIGGLNLAQSQGEIVRSTLVLPIVGDVYGQCDGFQILGDGVLLFNIMDRYNPNGEWMQSRIHLRVLGESIYYNSVNNEKAVSGGPGEGEVQIYDPTTGAIHVAGLTFKIRVPGYGMIFAETGALIFACTPYTFENCSLLSNVGQNQWLEADVAALCDYLQ